MTQPISLPMTHRYPFDYNPHPEETIEAVKLRRKFQQHQYAQLRAKVEKHSSIKHGCLIKINKAFQSKKKKYFDIMYQWVRYSFQGLAKSFSYAQLQQKKLMLLSLCQYLISMGIHPVIAQDLIGITQSKQIKLYVDVDFSPIIGPAQQLIRAKEIQISNVFKQYQRASLFEQHNSPRVSAHNFIGRQDSTNQKMIFQFPQVLPSQKIQQSHNFYVQTTDIPRYQSPPVYLYGSVDQSNQIKHHKIAIQRLNQRDLHESLPSQLIEISLRNKDQKQFQIDPSKLSQPDNSLLKKSSNNSKMKPQKDTTPPETVLKVEKSINNQENNKQIPSIQNKEFEKNQLIRQPRPFVMMMRQRFEKQYQQSVSIVDTYKQQLGSMRKMPKISNAQFRQTTKQPPMNFHVPNIERNRMSTGNPQLNQRLPLHRLQQQKSPQKQVRIKMQQQARRREQRLQNNYYYRQAFGFGFQKNDPLTREFISLLEDNQVMSEQVIQQQKQSPKNKSKNINEKVQQALKNSQRALQTFSKFKNKKF